MLMFCMVMWIGGIIYSIGMVHFAQVLCFFTYPNLFLHGAELNSFSC
jgi:hypothetical protein